MSPWHHAGARRGARCGADSFCLSKHRNQIHLIWSAFTAGPFKPVLLAGFRLSIARGARRAPLAERQFKCEFKLIDLVTIKSQCDFNNNTKTTSPLFLFQLELIHPRQHSDKNPFQPSLGLTPLESAPEASVMDCAARLFHLFEGAGNPFAVRGIKRRCRAAPRGAGGGGTSA